MSNKSDLSAFSITPEPHSAFNRKATYTSKERQVMSTLKDTLAWFQTAVPEPTDEIAAVQFGCIFEEVGELVQGGLSTYGSEGLIDLADSFKRQGGSREVDVIQRLQTTPQKKLLTLDALCDIIVTAVGAAHMMGWDIEGALHEVNRANYSKFEMGKPVFDENGKIKKGRDYVEPDLIRFI